MTLISKINTLELNIIWNIDTFFGDGKYLIIFGFFCLEIMRFYVEIFINFILGNKNVLFYVLFIQNKRLIIFILRDYFLLSQHYCKIYQKKLNF